MMLSLGVAQVQGGDDSADRLPCSRLDVLPLLLANDANAPVDDEKDDDTGGAEAAAQADIDVLADGCNELYQVRGGLIDLKHTDDSVRARQHQGGVDL